MDPARGGWPLGVRPWRLAEAFAAMVGLVCAGCPSVESPSSDCPDAGEKWFRRAQQSFQSADAEDATDSIKKALAVCPADPRLRVLAARVALARLDYAETIRQLKGVPGSEAAGLRGRALWYKCDLDAAADQLEVMLSDPDVKDEWAKSIAKLARRGSGRTCFAVSGGMLAAVDMPHVSPNAPYFVVPLEIDGESALSLVSTGNPEVILDNATRKEPSWVSLRFGKRLEVHDVPALVQDLSRVSRQMGAPIKALIGVNLLRHLNVTIDFAGRQFVARTFAPPPPPAATRVDLFYVRGGGMVVQSAFSDPGTRASLLVDTAQPFPIALDSIGWKKAGLDSSSLRVVPEAPEYKEGIVPMLRLGAYDVPKVPGVLGTQIGELEKALAQDIDGVIGNGLLAHFRITFGDGGRHMWIEDNAAVLAMLNARPRGPSSLPPPELPGPIDVAEPPPGPLSGGSAPADTLAAPATGSSGAPAIAPKKGPPPPPKKAPAPKGGTGGPTSETP